MISSPTFDFDNVTYEEGLQAVAARRRAVANIPLVKKADFLDILKEPAVLMGGLGAVGGGLAGYAKSQRDPEEERQPWLNALTGAVLGGAVLGGGTAVYNGVGGNKQIATAAALDKAKAEVTKGIALRDAYVPWVPPSVATGVGRFIPGNLSDAGRLAGLGTTAYAAHSMIQSRARGNEFSTVLGDAIKGMPQADVKARRGNVKAVIPNERISTVFSNIQNKLSDKNSPDAAGPVSRFISKSDMGSDMPGFGIKWQARKLLLDPAKSPLNEVQRLPLEGAIKGKQTHIIPKRFTTYAAISAALALLGAKFLQPSHETNVAEGDKVIQGAVESLRGQPTADALNQYILAHP